MTRKTTGTLAPAGALLAGLAARPGSDDRAYAAPATASAVARGGLP
jgi:hypothetical protein